jgi:hypothetical protein
MEHSWRYVDDRANWEEYESQPGPANGDLSHAWLRLQVLHTPFRSTDYREQAAFTDAVRELERIFLGEESLEPYYRECLRPEADAPTPTGEPAPPLPRSRQIDHAATMQALLMEEVFYMLRLVQYANAPDNRGWMNLFRRWGRSPSFNRRFDELRATLDLEFLEFYDLYIRYMQRRIDDDPVPHPWDSAERRRDPRAGAFARPEWTGGEPDRLTAHEGAVPFQDSAATQPEAPLLPGIFLDPGVREARRSGRNPGERPISQPGRGGGDAPSEGGGS